MKRSLLQILCCIVLSALGVVCLMAGNNARVEKNELIKSCTGEVQGKVVSYYVSGYYDENSDERLYRPIFEYEADGLVYSQQSAVGKRQKRFAVGEGVTIMYDPSNPDKYYVPADTYAANTWMTYIGVGIFLIATTVFLLIWKFVKKQ